jgi:hypothetical protein
MAESRKPGADHELEQLITSAQERPALDEATFQQLLEAAHVIQERKGFEVANRPRPDPAEALAKIVETQELLRLQTSDLQGAANLIAERLQEITHATGVAIAVVRDNQLEYCAATGDAASLAGSRLAMDSSLSAGGELSTGFIREIGDKSSMALPLHHEGKLAGLLEIRFADADSIQEPEIRSCQLMAGLMTEAIARATDREWRQTLAAERAAMLEALERIKPQLERLAVGPAETLGKPAQKIVAAKNVVEPVAETAELRATVPFSESGAKSSRNTICPQCGYQFGEQELFCGRCGSARPAGTLPSRDVQNKWASPWHLQQADENAQHQETENDSEETRVGRAENSEARRSHQFTPELSPELQNVIAQFSDQAGEPAAAPESDSGSVVDGEAENTAPGSLQSGEPPKSPSPWASATKTRKWLESLHPKSVGGIWLTKHRADIYVGAALVLLLIVLSGSGMRTSEHPVQSKNPPQASLTLLERLLVSLGLAETPPAPVYLGNPNAQVWVDLHTALYYCSDSDLYGKTQGGKFTTQRDAQLDQFEPAARKNCD